MHNNYYLHFIYQLFLYITGIELKIIMYGKTDGLELRCNFSQASSLLLEINDKYIYNNKNLYELFIINDQWKMQ